MIKFNEYQDIRDRMEFDKSFTKLCEAIARSGISVNEFWANSVLPVFYAQSYESKEEILSKLINEVDPYIDPDVLAAGAPASASAAPASASAAPASAPARAAENTKCIIAAYLLAGGEEPYFLGVDCKWYKDKKQAGWCKDGKHAATYFMYHINQIRPNDSYAYTIVSAQTGKAIGIFDKEAFQIRKVNPGEDVQILPISTSSTKPTDSIETPERQKQLVDFQNKIDQSIKKTKEDFTKMIDWFINEKLKKLNKNDDYAPYDAQVVKQFCDWVKKGIVPFRISTTRKDHDKTNSPRDNARQEIEDRQRDAESSLDTTPI